MEGINWREMHLLELQAMSVCGKEDHIQELFWHVWNSPEPAKFQQESK